MNAYTWPLLLVRFRYWRGPISWYSQKDKKKLEFLILNIYIHHKKDSWPFILLNRPHRMQLCKANQNEIYKIIFRADGQSRIRASEVILISIHEMVE